MLLQLAPAPLTRLHRSIARRDTAGPEAARAEVGSLAVDLGRYHLYATRADLLRTWAAGVKRGSANRRALELTANPAEQALLRRRIDGGDDAG